MTLDAFLNRLTLSPESLEFGDTMEIVETEYQFTETPFQNGDYYNQAGDNSGSCKLFSFAKKQGLSEQQTLACFGAYYRNDVLNNIDGVDHQNIRNFMKYGWQGIHFEGEALQAR